MNLGTAVLAAPYVDSLYQQLHKLAPLLERLPPEDMGEATCASCGDSFELGTVTAWAWSNDHHPVGEEDTVACPRCIEVLGSYRPDRFPTIEQYRRLAAEFPTTVYASGEEADAAWITGRELLGEGSA